MTFKQAVAFRPAPVTTLTVITYITLLASLLWIHLVPPSVAPSSELVSWGINFTGAWQDLRLITGQFRPYNAKRNDEVRDYLLTRIKEIVQENKKNGYDGPVEVVDDNDSNVLFAGESTTGLTVYFEGTNIIVHIHGTEEGLSPVLVNAHYDSVSTGYGATDDGMAVVSVLQIIQSFTHPDRKGDKRIKRGLVALLNNGEEDYLNGARAFAIHPMANISHSFLNLEGAGAGGRATLFRSTDMEVTKWYKQSKRPFGTIVSGDGFKQGLVKSQTDYKVFTENLGMRGLDVAFWEPRSRYHTQDDDVKHTSKESLWHMLGSSLEILEAATSDTSREFDHEAGNPAGTGHDGVWFDLFGRVFGLLRLHTLFALTITLIVVPFVVMALTTYFLYTNNKLYYLSNTPLFPQPPDSSNLPKTTRGWRGLFRFPVAFVIASATVIGVSFLVNKVNPMIVYSSQYSVWVMFLSIWWSLAWFVLRGADADTVRPTALGRGYAFIEQWLLWWVVLIAVAVSINRTQLASGYFILISYAGVFLSAWISLLELCGLPKKPTQEAESSRLSQSASYGSEGHSQIAPSDALPSDGEYEDATEVTPLFRGDSRPTTFGGYARRDNDGVEDSEEEYLAPEGIYGKEQVWSKDLPTWVWIIQFLLSVPVPLIFTASVGLVLSTALNQTGADGTSTLTIYFFMGILSIVLLLPGSPFYHRISYHVTTFIFVVFIGTLIYNITAFPFSEKYRLKVYFQQSVQLESTINTAYLVGHPDFVEDIVTNYIPSAQGQQVTVEPDPLRVGLNRVSWDAQSPAVVPGISGVPPEVMMKDWVQYNLTKLDKGKARISLNGRNTRACKLQFSKPVKEVSVWGNHKMLGKPVPEQGSVEVRLWSRTWEGGWVVNFSWDASEESPGLEGKAICLWSDANDARTEIPALWEVEQFLPSWAVVSKLADGLVEGWRPFMV
ncbi:hypothetical protein BDD12DRAFT_748261 [Trichophaea hybrida]|nr:hypothetical protein BDD12DRAFT_748261 [Trichophaea hybrida]